MSLAYENFDEWQEEPKFERFKKSHKKFDDNSAPRHNEKKKKRAKPQKRFTPEREPDEVF